MFKLILLYVAVSSGTFNEKVYDIPVDNAAACLMAAPTLERAFRDEQKDALIIAATCIADANMKIPAPSL